MFILDQFNRRWVISSFGGETPVSVVSTTFSATSTFYTAPSGKYFKGKIYISSAAAGTTPLSIGGKEISLDINTGETYEVLIPSGEAITSTMVAFGTVIGLLYNNPS